MHQRKPHLCDEEGDLNFDYKMNEVLKKRYDMFINMITPSLDFDMASSDSEAHDLDYEDITDDELEVFRVLIVDHQFHLGHARLAKCTRR